MKTSEPDAQTPHDNSTPTWSTARRRWLFATVAGAAAATGAGLSWWQAKPGDASTTTGTLPFWDMAFPTPDGDNMAMRVFAGKPLLLNFWATWCPPCIEEMPLLDRFYAESSMNGWQVLGMAVDQVSAVKRFLAQTPVRFPITLAGMSGVELSRSLGNSGGGLPFTVVFDRSGRITQRKIGQVKLQDLQEWRTLP